MYVGMCVMCLLCDTATLCKTDYIKKILYVYMYYPSGAATLSTRPAFPKGVLSVCILCAWA